MSQLRNRRFRPHDSPSIDDYAKEGGQVPPDAYTVFTIHGRLFAHLNLRKC